MAPSLISTVVSTNFGNSTSSKNTPATNSWLTGDLLTVWGITGDNASTLTQPPTMPGVTFANVLLSNVASRGKLYLWTATAGSAGTNQLLTGSISSTVEGGYVVKVWRPTGTGSFGTVSSLGSGTTGAASVAYTIAATGSAIDGGWVNWNQNTGARTYLATNLGAATERSYYTSATFATCGTWSNAGTTATGSQTIGLSAPNPLDAWLIAGIEVKDTGGGGGGTVVKQLSALGVG